jgi:hypothetical protein
VIGINESCTLSDDITCENGLNEFTDHDIALLFENRYHIANVTVAHAGHSNLPAPVWITYQDLVTHFYLLYIFVPLSALLATTHCSVL